MWATKRLVKPQDKSDAVVNLPLMLLLPCSILLHQLFSVLLSGAQFSSMRVACLYQWAMLVYDVFWVFFSPLFFGQSVMNEVASFLLQFPPGKLGEGDVMYPGMFLCLMYRADLFIGDILEERLPLLNAENAQGMFSRF